MLSQNNITIMNIRKYFSKTQNKNHKYYLNIFFVISIIMSFLNIIYVVLYNDNV